MESVFSPDGQWLVYFVSTGGSGAGTGTWTIKKIAVAGGAPVTLGQAATAPLGASWRNSTIVFGVNTSGTDIAKIHAIQSMPDTGGVPRTIVAVDPTKESAMQPQVLEDGKHLVFVVRSGGTDQIVLQALDGGARRLLIEGGFDPRILPTGQLVFVHDNTMLAVPFDAKGLAVTGVPVPIVEGVSQNTFAGTGQFAVASTGTLAFWPGAFATAQRTLVWVDRQGHEQPIAAKPRRFVTPRLSPDGTKVVVSADDEVRHLWVFDLRKDTLTRLTFGPASDGSPIWTADGQQIIFSSGTAESGVDIYRRMANGTAGETEALTKDHNGGDPAGLAADGKSLVVNRGGSTILVVPLDGGGPPRPLLGDPKHPAAGAARSPDGRWIAYHSSESGRPEVYVRPFPNVEGGRWQVSIDGGCDMRWNRSGREIVFHSCAGGEGRGLMSVALQPGARFEFDKPTLLFDDAPYYFAGRTNAAKYDISPDGSRFLMVKSVDNGPARRPSIVVVSHWFDEVTKRVK